jgi:hypothetical protein
VGEVDRPLLAMTVSGPARDEMVGLRLPPYLLARQTATGSGPGFQLVSHKS